MVIAHRLLEIVWYVLTRHEPYRHYSTERIAYKYLTWSWALDEDQRQGLTRPQPVLVSGQGLHATTVRLSSRRSLRRLGIGADLQRVALDPKYPHRLASEEEMLALRPDLRPPE